MSSGGGCHVEVSSGGGRVLWRGGCHVGVSSGVGVVMWGCPLEGGGVSCGGNLIKHFLKKKIYDVLCSFSKYQKTLFILLS